MRDPYLESILHGEFIKNKTSIKTPPNRFEKALEKNLHLYAETELLKEPGNPFLSPQIQKEKIEKDLRKTLQDSRINKHIEQALKVFTLKGKLYVGPEEYKRTQLNFSHTIQILNHLDLTKPINDNFGDLLEITPETVETLFKIALAEFEENQKENALSFFVFLTLLRPHFSDYWYRLGLVASQCECNEMALRAYAVTLALDPGSVGARIFSISCYLKLGLREDAIIEFREAQKCIQSGSVPEEWKALLEHSKALIQQAKKPS